MTVSLSFLTVKLQLKKRRIRLFVSSAFYSLINKGLSLLTQKTLHKSSIKSK